MPVYVTLPLFGTPGQELEESVPLNGRQLRHLGDELRDRLHKAAGAIDRLVAAGWDARIASNDVILRHPAVKTPDDAARQWSDLGLDPEMFLVFEDIDDEGA
jgi:hypothetical protein